MGKSAWEGLGGEQQGCRRLLRVIQSQRQEGHNDSAQVQQTQAQQVYHQGDDVDAHTLAEDTQRKLHVRQSPMSSTIRQPAAAYLLADKKKELPKTKGPVLEPLSAPQPTFEHRSRTFSKCSLLHKLLITGQGEQVVSRWGELNRDLLTSTCKYK